MEINTSLTLMFAPFPGVNQLLPAVKNDEEI